MLRKSTLTVLSVLAFAGGILGTTSAAMADPPWARGGGRGFHHGGPPPWAPAHGWRRKHDFGGYGGRSYRSSRYNDGRRYDRYGY